MDSELEVPWRNAPLLCLVGKTSMLPQQQWLHDVSVPELRVGWMFNRERRGMFDSLSGLCHQENMAMRIFHVTLLQVYETANTSEMKSQRRPFSKRLRPWELYLE